MYIGIESEIGEIQEAGSGTVAMTRHTLNLTVVEYKNSKPYHLVIQSTYFVNDT